MRRARRAGLAVSALFAAATATGCGGPSAADTPSTAKARSAPPVAARADAGAKPLAGKASTHVARMLAYVSQLRQLTSSRAVPGERLSRKEMVERVRIKAVKEYPPEVLRREGRVLELMDFAPPGFDYLAETLKLLEAQLEGFYEPSDGTMYVAAELDGEEADATLAHELVHALQDQHWDLKSRSEYKPGRSDETLALAALAEGDATSLMMDFMLEGKQETALDVPEQQLRAIMLAGMSTPNVQSVPHLLRASLVSPYVEGVAFVNTLRRRGRWKGVDAAWARVPTTTEQVLHPEKWEKNEPAIPIPAPTARALGAGFVSEDEDTAGELGYALMFGEWMRDAEARLAAAGWGGDRSVVVTRGDEIASADHLRFDAAPGPSEAYAERAFALVKKGLASRYGKPAADAAAFVCFERATTGPLAVLRRERDLVITAGPARSKGSTWTSSSTCGTARAWAEEVATAKAAPVTPSGKRP